MKHPRGVLRSPSSAAASDVSGALVAELLKATHALLWAYNADPTARLRRRAIYRALVELRDVVLDLMPDTNFALPAADE